METNDSDSLPQEQIENIAEHFMQRMFNSAMEELLENSRSLWTATGEYEVVECVLRHLAQYSRVKRAELIDREHERIAQILAAYEKELGELEAVLHPTQGVADVSANEPDAGERLSTEKCMGIVDEFLQELECIKMVVAAVMKQQRLDLMTATAAKQKVRSIVAVAIQGLLDHETARHEYHNCRLNELDDVIEKRQRNISMLQRE